MGSKPYYYNKNGETVEVHQVPHSKLQKVAICNRLSGVRQEQSKRSNELRSEVTVEYQ